MTTEKVKPMVEKKLIKKGSKNGAIAVTDPLQRYLQEVHAYPMLTPEEEVELARRYHEEGDIEAAKKLVTTHLRLVAKIAMEYRNAYHNVLDLIQEGNVGLMQAVAHFSTEGGARLGHYASWWIRSFILKYILENFRLIKLGTTKEQKKLFYNLMREKERIEKMGYYATSSELSRRLGVDEKKVIDMEHRLTTPEYSMHAPVGSGDGEALLEDFLPVDDAQPDEHVAREETRDLLAQKFKEFAGGLNERDLKIFEERLMAELPLTLKEIAEEYGITKERVRQLEARLIGGLKAFLQESGIDEGTLQF